MHTTVAYNNLENNAIQTNTSNTQSHFRHSTFTTEFKGHQQRKALTEKLAKTPKRVVRHTSSIAKTRFELCKTFARHGRLSMMDLLRAGVSLIKEASTRIHHRLIKTEPDTEYALCAETALRWNLRMSVGSCNCFCMMIEV